MYLNLLRTFVLLVAASAWVTASEAGQATDRDVVKVATVQVCGYDKAAMFQNSVALVTANQTYGGGTMIADWPATIKAASPPKEEHCISATIDLKRLRHIRTRSRNYQQRRPELYGEVLKRQTAWGETTKDVN